MTDDPETDEIIRKGAEAYQRILDARTREHKAVATRQTEAFEKLKMALMEYYKASIEHAFHSYLDGRPENESDVLEWLEEKDDAAIDSVVGNLSHESWQDELPGIAWWMLDDILDILAPLKRGEVVAFWKGTRQ